MFAIRFLLTLAVAAWIGDLGLAQGAGGTTGAFSPKRPIAGAPSSGSYSSLLFNNGGYLTNVGNGFGGADTSEIESPLTGYGVLWQEAGGNHLADDLAVPPSKIWALTTLKWYGYQIGAPPIPASSITDVRLQVWDQRPDQPGAVVLHGDATTNRLLSSSFTNCYRVRNTAVTDNRRAIFELQIDLSWLPPLHTGSYWLDVTAVGNGAYFGAWAVPSAPWRSTDNSVQLLNGSSVWVETKSGMEGFACDFPFRLEGTEISSPSVYCTAKTNSQSCVPAIGSTGLASATAGVGFVISSIDNLNNTPGLLLYGSTGPTSFPFLGGFLCINAPQKRTTVLASGGTASPVVDCTGVFTIDMNAFAAGSLGGNPAPELTVAGTTVDCQFWGRDPGFPSPDNVSLSDALEYQIGP